MAERGRLDLGAVAGIVCEETGDATGLIEEMLRTMKHRGTQTGTASLEPTIPSDPQAAIGCASHQNPEARIAASQERAVAVDGSFFETKESSQARFVLAQFKDRSVRSTVASLLGSVGGYSCLILRGKGVLAFRDINGLKSLYVSHYQGNVAFASERKALWKIGLKETERVHPGQLYSTAHRKMTRVSVGSPPRLPQEMPLTLSSASSRLSTLLTKSIRRVTRNVDKVAVAFSGGLDSAVTATLAKIAGRNVELISVGLPGSSELSTADRCAKDLGLRFTLETFATDLLEEYVQRVIWLIEEPNLMKVSIAVPLHWAAMVAAKRGYKVMLCGQGSDELYGGYYKYARTLDEKGPKALRAELYRSVLQASEVNYERDDQATAPSGVELRTPFADREVIKFSLGIPTELKVKPGNDLTRKWVLRDVAKRLGLPEETVWKRKKAIQHGTGVENAIRKIAKSRNLTTDEYLLRVHRDVVRLESMP
jgi:asparagine synthase (glutamine-hydrolysing)